MKTPQIWHKTTAELITASEAAIRELGFEVQGEACERWDEDGVMLVTPKRAPPASDDKHWYLSIAGSDNEFYGDTPSVDLILIRPPEEDRHDDHVVLKDWGHLKTLLIEDGFLKAS